MHAFITLFSRRRLLSYKYRILMAKRLMVVVVGAGIGSLVGLLVAVLGIGTPALIIGAVAGALIPLLVLGPPGR
jgi:hypothetical protein